MTPTRPTRRDNIGRGHGPLLQRTQAGSVLVPQPVGRLDCPPPEIPVLPRFAHGPRYH